MKRRSRSLMCICCTMLQFRKRYMNYNIKVKKLGNHWYPDIPHDDPSDLCLTDKIERCLSIIDKECTGCLNVFLYETCSFIDENTILMNDDDIREYFTTDHDFNLRFYVRDCEFEISSTLYWLLEQYYNPNFHKVCYKIEISNWTV